MRLVEIRKVLDTLSTSPIGEYEALTLAHVENAFHAYDDTNLGDFRDVIKDRILEVRSKVKRAGY